jgi:streptomycin 6-kinase
VEQLRRQWSLTILKPIAGGAYGAWVAPVVRADGTQAILKIAMRHMEGEHEIHGLRFWDGDPTVRLFGANEELGAMLLERCEPGTSLRGVPEDEQDVVIARLLRRLWRTPPGPPLFRPLSFMLECWTNETLEDSEKWTDAGLVREGLHLFKQMSSGREDDVLLATDLHAGNVLRAEREPWLVIDPKPFLGDRAYDATQHLLNCRGRLSRDPHGTISRFADLLEVDPERVRRWTFARAAAEPRREWNNDDLVLLARRLA